MMKKILLPLLLIMSLASSAQWNNDWIDHSKTYYRFQLAKDSLVRIPQSVLSSAGLSAVNADHFQLWRNGEQVRIYTSVTAAPLPAGGYIEFWGLMNDGKTDKILYRNPDFQLADKYSLENDTVSYFLTVNTAGGNLRYDDAVNGVPSSPTPDAYFMRKVEIYYRTQINRGLGYDAGEYVYSSAYDQGEGWSGPNITSAGALTQEFRDLNVYTAGPANSLSVWANITGNAPNIRNARVRLQALTVHDAPLPGFSYVRVNVNNLPLSTLNNPTSAFMFVENASSNVNDRITVPCMGFTYPATFNFNNSKNFYFELAASASGNHLLIDNFNFGSTAPALYDLTNGKRYTGDITSVPGRVKFGLPATTTPLRKFMLVSQQTDNILLVNALSQKQFSNFTAATQQGDYMIISHSALFNDGNGNNYVDQYRQYRASANGGSFNAKVYDINEINDQFGFGIRRHPDALRNFILYADQQFTVKPKHVFIIGRGVAYADYRALGYENDPRLTQMDFVQTFGWPPSDVLLACPPGTVAPVVATGRLSAINGNEVNTYLQKMIEYETAQRSQSCNIGDKAWMKNILHVVGGKDSSENILFRQYMQSYENIAEDSLFGGHVETFTKTTNSTIQEANSQRILQLFNEGISVIGYFGHSSATTFEFNLSSPQNYNNPGKYPFFNASGCNAGNYYTFDPSRVNSGNLSLSEKYVLANQRGSIAFLADTHFGVPPFLDFYNRALYTAFSRTMYGNSVGNQIKKVITDLYTPGIDFLNRVHIEEIALHGDPALKINNFNSPDYVVEDPLVKISPNIISVADLNFNIKVRMMNIGRASTDSIKISVKRRLPNNALVVLYDSLVPAIDYMDSLNFNIQIQPTQDKGLNQLLVSLDYTGRVNELCETNNNLVKDFYIFEDELRPSYPYNFSIVNQQNITYIANTANPLSENRQYVMEIDTTELFNSAFKKTYNTSGAGGVIEFRPTNINFTDSTVYYWRVATVPSGTQSYIWNSHSFIYLQNGGPGFNQSHYFQKQKSSYDDGIVLGDDRKLKFTFANNELSISTGNFPPNDHNYTFINMGIYRISNWGNQFNTLQFVVFDGVTGAVRKNQSIGGVGLFGSNNPGSRVNQFEFPFSTPEQRKKAMNFLKAMPQNSIIIMYNLIFNSAVNQYAASWAGDATYFGSQDSSLYHYLKSYGFSQLDQFDSNKPFIFKFIKENPAAMYQAVGENSTQILTTTLPITLTRTEGVIISPVFGPATTWTQFHWGGYPKELVNRDSVRFKIIGINNTGSETQLMVLDTSNKHVDISSISATQYPYLKLRMDNYDSLKGTPYELDYWRLNYVPVPEGAIATNLLYSMTDSVTQGEMVSFAVAFKNIGQVAFRDSIKVELKVTDANNTNQSFYVPKLKALQPGDTAIIRALLDTRNLSGLNTLVLDVNPGNDQPEQQHTNNVLFADLFVNADRFNPLLDVTFDAVHILNGDIVFSKPNILIKLKDESRFLALKDTSLLKVQVRYPDGILHNYHFNGDTMRFIPADLSAGENTASIEFRPYFPEDGEYELIVSGKDVNGNPAGYLNYSVQFNVYNKEMISNLLNYPNPFTTSTAFVFTVTGSVPQNLRIQILTVTGKVVREITKDELGPIHAGNNITDFKWDGTDMYGQKLANGVYLYRVITNNDGKSVDAFAEVNQKIEVGDGNPNRNNKKYKFFKKGYGKMYLMR